MGLEVFPAIAIFSIPLLIIWTKHQRKMFELQMQRGNSVDGGVRAEIESLRQEMRALRDTCTQYDLSFDTALQRMERRVEGVERRVMAIPQDEAPRVSIGR